MILQALTDYYEQLLARGAVAQPGFVKVPVSWGLQLAEDGALLGLFGLRQPVLRNKKQVFVPQQLTVPQPVKRSCGIAANFLCDTSSYLLGIDAKGKPDRTAECFAAARKLHEQLLLGAQSEAACAVRAFFTRWDPNGAAEHPALRQNWNQLLLGGNFVFWYKGRPVTEDLCLKQCWQRACNAKEKGQSVRCLVTGSYGPVARLHPNIKGVAGAQSSGAALVSFNVPAFCSYGQEQGNNAPTGEYAAFAYTTALNYLLADQEHTRRVGDTTIVCWAAGGQAAYQDFMLQALYGEAPSAADIQNAMVRLAQGLPVDWQKTSLSPGMRFYVLGLAPNAGRLSVRFFWQDSFGVLARNVARHYNQLEIVRPSYDPFPTLPIWRLMQEVVREKGEQPPRLAEDFMQAVLSGRPYPAILRNSAVQLIRAQRNITRPCAAVLKAWYLRNFPDEQIKEIMTVELNEQSNYLPYVLGRLFAVLEAVQQRANPGVNTKIRDRYFNSASAAPAMVFPLLINLAQKHLAKLDERTASYYNKQLTALNARIEDTLPARMTLPEQSAFQIGYYHETQKRYAKKEEK